MPLDWILTYGGLAILAGVGVCVSLRLCTLRAGFLCIEGVGLGVYAVSAAASWYRTELWIFGQPLAAAGAWILGPVALAYAILWPRRAPPPSTKASARSNESVADDWPPSTGTPTDESEDRPEARPPEAEGE